MVLSLAADALPPVDLVPVPWWALLGGVLVLEGRHVHLSLGRHALRFTLGELGLVLCLVALPIVWAVPVYASGCTIAVVLRRTTWTKVVYNGALFAAAAAAAGLVHRAVLWGADVSDVRGWVAGGLALLVYAWVSLTLVGLAVWLTTGRPVWRDLRGDYVASTAMAPTLASFALVAVVLLSLRPLAVLLLLAPLAFLVWSWSAQQRYRETSEGVEALYRFTRSLGATTGVAESAEVILREATELLHTGSAELVLMEGDEARVFRLPRRDETDPVVREGRFARWADVPWVVGAAGASLHLDADASGPVAARLRASASEAGGPLMAGPLLHDGRVLGALLVAGRQGTSVPFRPEERSLFEALCGHAAVALLAAELVDRLRAEASRREHEALYDGLTGLRNRRALVSLCEDALGGIAAGRRLALAVLDVDLFKEVNDTLGHAVGDRLLQEVGVRLAGAVRGDERVARLGGDEFAILLPDIPDEAAATATVERVLASLRPPLALEEVRLSVAVTTGLALGPEDGDTPESLLRRADVALHTGKQRGTRLEPYRRADDVTSRRRLDLLSELPHALTDGQITVTYQPKVNASDGRVTGVEALVRWDSPRFGDVSPTEFVPLAEANGILRGLTRQVLDTALRQTARWAAEGRPLGVAVNISTRALLDEGFPGQVEEALARSGVPGDRLTLEITEGSVMREVGRSLDSLHRLHALGVRLAVDDFGTGWSSLSYLTRLPVSEVKIDRSFVVSMTSDPADAAVVSSTIRLAHELGMAVVAEGVESHDVWRRLADLGCDQVQGFLVHAPAAAEVISTWLDQRHLHRNGPAMAAESPPGPRPRLRALPERGGATG